MKNKILKPIKRFWRGFTVRSRVALCILLSAALLLGAFGIYMLVRPDTTDAEGTRSLFPGVERTQIESVLCHTASGAEYTVLSKPLVDENGKETGYRRFIVKTSDGKEHTGLSLNSMQLSYFVVGTGKNYVYSDVTSRAEDADYESKRKELGFSENSPYYELKLMDKVLTDETGRPLRDENGEQIIEKGATYRVYYGVKDVTGDGYFVQLAGEDAIYSTKSAFIGDLLQEDGPESLIDPTLFYPAQNNYAYAFPYRYAMRDYVHVETEGRVITAEDYAVGYLLADGTAGSCSLQSYDGESAASKALRNAYREFFIGKQVGECNETFTFTYPDSEEIDKKLRGTTVEFTLKKIKYAAQETLRYEVQYLPTLDRDLSHKLSAYGYTAPADIVSYIPDSDAMMSMLQSTMELSGTVVKLGLDEAVLNDEKYGNMYRHQIHFFYTIASELKSTDEKYKVHEGDSDAVKEEKGQLAEQAFFNDSRNFIPGYLYVGDIVEEDGVEYRYVASMLYDLVIRVEASSLAFMDQTPIDLVDDFVLTAQITDVLHFQMNWNYGEGRLSGVYDFDVTFSHVLQLKGEYVIIKDENGQFVSEEAKKLYEAALAQNSGGAQLVKMVTRLAVTYPDGTSRIFDFSTNPNVKNEIDIYYQLYMRMTYTHYRGEHSLSDAEVAALLADADACAMKLAQSLTDGATNYWEFYPISANRVLVRVKNGAPEYGDSFVIYGTDLSAIAHGFLQLLEGNTDYDHAERYE